MKLLLLALLWVTGVWANTQEDRILDFTSEVQVDENLSLPLSQNRPHVPAAIQKPSASFLDEGQGPKEELQSPRLPIAGKESHSFPSLPTEEKPESLFSGDFLDEGLSLLGPSDDSSDFLKSGIIALVFLGVLGLLSAFLVKNKKGGFNKIKKPEEMMRIVSILPLSPKRQIILIEVQGHLMTLASTESGISFMTELQPERPERERGGRLSSGEGFSRSVTGGRSDFPSLNAGKNESEEETFKKRSEVLLKTLKNIPKSDSKGDGKLEPSLSNGLRYDSFNAEAELADKRDPYSPQIDYRSEKMNYRTEKEERADVASKLDIFADDRGSKKFPKYLADSFKEQDALLSSNSSESAKSAVNEDNAQAVTNLIKEKIKSMKSLG